jgi:hypothetical protein
MNIETLIAAANPVPTAAAPGADSLQARQTLARLLAEPAGRSGPGRPSRLNSRRLGLVAGGLAAAAAAAVAAAVVLLPGASGRPGPPAGATSPLSRALGELALVASGQPVARPPGPGQYQYTDSKSLTWSDTYVSAKIHFSVSYQQHRQIWIAANGSGRIKETNTDPDFASPRDRAAWIAAGRPSLRQAPWDQRFGKHGLALGPVNLLKLPTRPAKLYALLRARKIEGGPPGAAEDFVQVGDLLRETDAPPALRAALFKVCARIPGARLLGTVTDPLGSRGIAFARSQLVTGSGHGSPRRSRAESVLIFNPSTSGLLAEETLVTTAGKTTLTAWTVYLKSGVVNSVTSTRPVTGNRGGSSA